jgi:hypothetical protein
MRPTHSTRLKYPAAAALEPRASLVPVPKRVARAAGSYGGLRPRRLGKRRGARVQHRNGCPQFLALRLFQAARRRQLHQALRAFNQG